MLKSMEPQYRPEPVDSTIEPTEVTVSHVAAGREGVVHPIKKFAIMPESLAGLFSILIISLVGLGCLLANVMSSGGATRIQSLVALAPFCLWLCFHAVKGLRRRSSFDWCDHVTLDTDRLICEQGHRREPKTIHYEQICAVKLRIVRNKEIEQTEAGPVEVNYYEYDKQTSALNLSRLRSIVLPKTEDDAILCSEIRHRSFGPSPNHQARIGLAVWQIALWLLPVLLYLLYVEIVRVMAEAIT